MIVLDTHVFLWLNLSPGNLSDHIISALKGEDHIGLSAISLWEIAMLKSRRRITIREPLLEWLRTALDSPRLSVLPLTAEIAARSEYLPMHGDPADRLIAATAMEYDCPLATADKLLVALPMLKTIS